MNADKKNILYVFKNDKGHIEGVHIDFNDLKKTLYAYNYDITLSDDKVDEKGGIQLYEGNNIYRIFPDEIIYVNVKRVRDQIDDYIPTLNTPVVKFKKEKK